MVAFEVAAYIGEKEGWCNSVRHLVNGFQDQIIHLTLSSFCIQQWGGVLGSWGLL